MLSLFLPKTSSCKGKVEKTILKNGLVVLTKEIHTAPIVACLICYRVGARNETETKTGLSHFLEHMMFKGTDLYKKGEIDQLTLENGGQNNAFTSYDYTGYHFKFASDRWEIALEIEANRMKNCTFLGEEFDLEKQVVLEEINMDKDDPFRVLYNKTRSTAFQIHPYGRPILGWLEDVKGTTREDMFNYYNTYYNPQNAVLVITGDFNTKKTMAKIRELFGKIPPYKGIIPVCKPKPEPLQKQPNRLVLEMETKVPRMVMMYHKPAISHSSDYPLVLISSILSMGKSSRLYQKLVEGFKLLTSISTNSLDWKDPSTFEIYASLKPETDVEQVENAIIEELAKLKTQAVTAKELGKAKKQAEAAFIFSNESIMAQAELLGNYETLISYRYLDKYLSNLRKVSRKDIQQAARKIFSKENSTIGVLLPKKNSDDKNETILPNPEDLNRKFRPNSPVSTAKKVAAALNIGFKAEKIIRHVLPNGLIVLLMENCDSETVAIKSLVKAGSRYDPEEKAGLASLTAVMLEKGTKKRSSLQIATAIEEVGGVLSAASQVENSSVGSYVLSKDFGLGLELVADLLQNPAFGEKELAAEKSKVIANIKASQDLPMIVGGRWLSELIYKGHPRHHPAVGYEETVKEITAKDLHDFHHTYYKPNNTILTVVGNISAKEALRKIKNRFGNWKKEEINFPVLPKLERQKEIREKLVLMKDKKQLNIFLGHLGVKQDIPDDEYYPLLVMDVILGSGTGFTSRLLHNLRDSQGLAYYAYANITDSAALEEGRFLAFIATSPENKERAIKGILEEVRKIRSEPVTAEELDGAKAYLTGTYVFRFENNLKFAAYLLECELYKLGFDYMNRHNKLIKAVTIEDIQRVAEKYLDTENYSLVIAGPINQALSLT